MYLLTVTGKNQHLFYFSWDKNACLKFCIAEFTNTDIAHYFTIFFAAASNATNILVQIFDKGSVYIYIYIYIERNKDKNK